MNIIANIISAGWTVLKSYIKWTIILWVIVIGVGLSLAEAKENKPFEFNLTSEGFVVTTDYQRLQAVMSDAVKKSKSEICHAPDSPYYLKTKNYTAYPTLEDCLASSDKARLPKNYKVKDKS